MFAESRNKPTWNPTWNLNGHPLDMIGKKFILTQCGTFAEAETPPKHTNMEPNLEPKWAPLGPDRWKIILTQCGMFAEAEPARNTPTWNPTWNLNGQPLDLVGEKLS